jgi:hypothetical protein
MSGVWTVLGGIFGLFLLVVWVISIVDIVRSHLGAGKTAAWLLIVLLLPFVGSLLYWTLRQPSREEIQYQADSERALRESAHDQAFDHTGLG